MKERIFCIDCQEDLTPTSTNGEGWLFHMIAGHRMVTVKTGCDDLPILALVPEAS